LARFVAFSGVPGAVTKLTVKDCELCEGDGGEVLWQDDFCRVVAVVHPDYPGFCRVILRQHISEMTQLEPPLRDRMMQAVFATETLLREQMSPQKINLASLGNVVPHLHWHVIPRFSDDRHFPDSIWAAPKRESAPKRAIPDKQALASGLRKLLG
jgi:diadenosine tetraphosphate (Ap4A) HIT family hydrolase